MSVTASIRTAGVVLFVALAAFHFSCARPPRLPPQPVKIVGASYNPQLVRYLGRSGATQQPAAMRDILSSGTIEALGEARMPAFALDPLEARLAARQMAKQDARRNLARKLAEIELRPGQTLGDLVGKDEQKRRKLEEIVRRALQKGLISADRDKYSVCMVLGRGELEEIARLAEPDRAGPDSSTAQAEEFRRRAEREALDDARMRALEYVKSLRLANGETLGERMVRDDRLDTAIRTRIAALQPLTVSFREDGTCEAVVVVDLAEIRRIVAGRPRNRIRGFRLPHLPLPALP